MIGENVSILAVGDIGPQREHPEEVFDLTRSVLRSADITFGQLEDSLSKRGTPQLQSLGRRIHPSFAKGLADAGFDVMSHASNLTMAYSAEALFDTLDALKENGIAVIGAGRNIREARQPAVFDIKGTKIGFLGYCSVIPHASEARENQPGAAPLRASTMYEPIDWQAGTPPRIVTCTNPDDLTAMTEDIKADLPELISSALRSIAPGIEANFVPKRASCEWLHVPSAGATLRVT